MAFTPVAALSLKVTAMLQLLAVAVPPVPKQLITPVEPAPKIAKPPNKVAGGGLAAVKAVLPCGGLAGSNPKHQLRNWVCAKVPEVVGQAPAVMVPL